MKTNNFKKNVPIFKVKSIDAHDPNVYRQVFAHEKRYECECETFIRCVIICRHIFYAATMRQEKNFNYRHFSN